MPRRGGLLSSAREVPARLGPTRIRLFWENPKLNELFEQLNQTKAIGVFTKLSIKNNATRLQKSFAVYHQGKRPPNLEELRERYDLMVQEMLILVQDKDPELTRIIHEARLLLWSYLSDPEKYKYI